MMLKADFNFRLLILTGLVLAFPRAAVSKVSFDVVATPKGVYLRWDVPDNLKNSKFVIYRHRAGTPERKIINEKPIVKAKNEAEIRERLGEALEVLVGDDPVGDTDWNKKSRPEREAEIFKLLLESDVRMEILSFVVPQIADVLGVRHIDATADKTATYTYTLFEKRATSEKQLAQKKIKASSVPKIQAPAFYEPVIDNKKVTVLWNKLNPKSGVVGYNIYRNDFETGEFRRLNKFPIFVIEADQKKGKKPMPVAFTDTTVENEKEYWYRVRAYHAAGFEGEWSDKLRVFPVDTTRPQPVLLLKAETGQDGTIHVRWRLSEEKNISSYNVYRSNSQKGDWKKINAYPIPSNVNWYDDDMDKVGTVMWYKVTAVNDKKIESLYSNSAFTKVTRFARPARVKILKVAPGENFVDISWTKSNDPYLAFYEVYRSHSAKEEMMPQKRIRAGKLSYRDTNVKPGHTYYYSVMVIDQSEKKSELSDQVSGGPIDNRPVYPPALSARSYETSAILTWTPVPGDLNNGFNIYRRKAEAGGVFQRLNKTPLAKTATGYTDQLPYEKGDFEYYITTVSVTGSESKPSTYKRVSVWESTPGEVTALMVVPTLAKGKKKSPALVVQWQPVADKAIVGYRVYRSEVAGKKSGYNLVGYVTVPSNSLLDKKIKPGIRYGYYVVAVDKRGNEGQASRPEFNSYGDPIK